MAMVGADVDQLRGLARSLTQAADRLEAMAGEVNSRLGSTPWQGQDAQQFRSQWQGESLALVRAVVNALRAAAAETERNANEQEQASGGTGSGGLSSSPLSPAQVAALQETLRNGLPNFFGNPLAPFVDIRDFLGANTIWPINNGFALGHTPLGPILPLLDALGIAGDTSLSPEEKIAEAGHSMTDLAGGLIKDVFGLSPAGYLSGVAVAQWGDVAYEASKADFSPAAVQTTVDYIASDPGGAFKAASDAVLGYVPKLFSNLF